MLEVEMLTPFQPAGLPLPNVISDDAAELAVACAVSPMSLKGRISDTFCIRELGWRSGTTIRVGAVSGKAIVARADGLADSSAAGHEQQRVDISGHLRLLASTRRVAGFSAGDRLLLVADLEGEALHIMSTKVLSRLMNPAIDTLVVSGLMAQ